MNEIIERASQALHDAAGTGVPWEELREQSRAFIRKMMRAAIEAMREPTEAMGDAASACADWGPPGYYNHENGEITPEKCWRAMIDAALKESAPTPEPPSH